MNRSRLKLGKETLRNLQPEESRLLVGGHVLTTVLFTVAGVGVATIIALSYAVACDIPNTPPATRASAYCNVINTTSPNSGMCGADTPNSVGALCQTYTCQAAD